MDGLPKVTVLPKEIMVILGHSLNVSCILEGSPLITRITWFKNDEEANNTLSIPTVKQLDKGRYTCMATTRVGKAFDEAEVFVVEDINECDEEQQCEYQCENISGSYNCICPRGYELDNNRKCFDINECDVVSCANGQMCLNTLGDFHCIPNPCPENYSLSQNTDCIPKCKSCSVQPINIRQISLHKGYRTDNGIGKVTVYDRSGSVLEDTVFAISDTESGLKLGSTKSGPFSIRSRRGEAVVYTSSRELPPGSIYYLRVRARSHSSNHADSHFMLIISTGMYPF
ncbi:unnamed protein product [Angiostrongylus costaricensis]|uniref:Ig-like domain-containing protein n=1 Tax=Angiostrongylus costaricensis TaxID=334426 RepID=A0A0R3PD13_ANGCS|nr:unnamed protein product [Angiostrongylus costaricensis]